MSVLNRRPTDSEQRQPHADIHDGSGLTNLTIQCVHEWQTAPDSPRGLWMSLLLNLRPAPMSVQVFSSTQPKSLDQPCERGAPTAWL